MSREGRPPNYMQDQFDEVWQLYRSGNKLWDIARAFDINPGSIYIIFTPQIRWHRPTEEKTTGGQANS